MLLQAARRPDGSSLPRHTVRAVSVKDGVPAVCPTGQRTRIIHGHSRAGENAADLQKRWSSRLHP